MLTKIVALVLMIGALLDSVALDVLVATKKFVTMFPPRSPRVRKRLVASHEPIEKRRRRDRPKAAKRPIVDRPLVEKPVAERPVAAGASTRA